MGFRTHIAAVATAIALCLPGPTWAGSSTSAHFAYLYPHDLEGDQAGGQDNP